MKTNNKIPPRILQSPDQPRVYQIKIHCRNGLWADLRYSSQEVARQEYDRIRGVGIFAASWIETIEIGEINL